MTEIGINAHIPETKELDKIQALGMKHIRCDFNWDWIEPEKGVHDWTVSDNVVKECADRGLTILPTIGYTPVWANGNNSRNVPPTDMNDWINFVYAVVRRYSDIPYWSIWNEPNVPDYFKGTIKDYGENILVPAASVIHEHRKLVVAPGIATTKKGWSTWLQEMEWYSYKGFLDIVSIHHYNTPVSKAIKALEKGSWLGRWFPWLFPDRQAILDLAKRVTNRIWLTEIGWSTYHVTEYKQAIYYRDIVEWDNSLERIYFYEITDDPFVVENFGVLRSDWSEKIVYRYLKDR